MAGVKQFGRNQLLSRAMMMFWRNGYPAASIHDLAEATGVNRGSLYAAFGDKRGLFLAVLGHYVKHIASPMMAELNNPIPRLAIEAMLSRLSGATVTRNGRVDASNTNTSLECPR